MKIKSKSTLMTQRFINWVHEFSKEHKLFMPESAIVVGLSGGADSVLLLHFFKNLLSSGQISNLRAFHLNHSSREGQDKEQAFVEDLCKQLSIELVTYKLPSNIISKSNFEAQARKYRYDFFYKNLKENELLALGHHLDDSFEWYLMNQFKSSNTKVLGIPVKNNKIIRPLMCLSKRQIINILKVTKREFVIDPSNYEISYERNFIRQLIHTQISKKYPQYLKHYVNRVKQLQNLKNTNKKKLLIKNIPNGKIIINPELSHDFVPYFGELKNLIHEMSGVGRGTIQTQLDKLIHAIKNQKTGPMIFSGNLNIYFDGHYIIMTKTNYLPIQNIVLNHQEINFQSMDIETFKKVVLENYSLFASGPIVVAIEKENYFGKDLVSLNELKNFYKFEKHNSVVFQSANGLIQKWQNKKNLKNRILRISILKQN